MRGFVVRKKFEKLKRKVNFFEKMDNITCIFNNYYDTHKNKISESCIMFLTKTILGPLTVTIWT